MGLVVFCGPGEAAEVPGQVEGDGGGVGAVDGYGRGLVAHIVQGLQGVAEEFFGETLPAVVGVGEKLCHESSSGSVGSEVPLCGGDGCGEAAF
jgi:hypothetical protein